MVKDGRCTLTRTSPPGLSTRKISLNTTGMSIYGKATPDAMRSKDASANGSCSACAFTNSASRCTRDPRRKAAKSMSTPIKTVGEPFGPDIPHTPQRSPQPKSRIRKTINLCLRRQRGIKRELQGLILFLTHRLEPSQSSCCSQRPHEYWRWDDHTITDTEFEKEMWVLLVFPQ